MMNIAVISFTANGRILADRIAAELGKEQYRVTTAVKCTGEADSFAYPLSQWTKEQFAEKDALIFVGAVGIAVRAIAPYVSSKTKDAAVLAVDEKGRYCIPLLSGHIGGANELALLLCQKIQAEPVITTATDLNQKWAVDVFAARNRLYIESMKKAKNISVRALKDEPLTIRVEEGANRVEGVPPKGVTLVRDTSLHADIYIGVYGREKSPDTLCLIPQTVSIGIGCKKGTKAKAIEAAVSRVFDREGICPQSIEKAATIEMKAEEEGLLDFCRMHNLKLEVYSKEELKEVQGVFSGSEFVEQITGVDNVCERSAIKASGSGTLLVRKQSLNGITVAVALRKWGISFE